MNRLSSTYTNADTEPLTLERLEKVIADLEARRPVMHYATSDYLPIRRDDGEPMMYWVPTSVFSPYAPNDPWINHRATHLLVFHPDNLAHVQKRMKGHYRLVDVRTPSPQEPTP